MTKKTEAMLDKIKDGVDKLGDIPKAKERVEAAQDLISYIENCYVHYQEDRRDS